MHTVSSCSFCRFSHPTPGLIPPKRTTAPQTNSFMRILSFLLLLLLGQTAHATTRVISRDYGYDPVNATRFLQQALDDTAADTLIFDAAPGPWTSEPLLLTRDDVTLIFEPGTLLRGISTSILPAAFGTFQSLLHIKQSDNITLLGNGATLQMFKREYDISSEFRHCLLLSGVTNVLVRDLVTTGAAGDGIFVSPAFRIVDGQGIPDIPCRDVTVINCTMDDNNRQGMSVSDVIGLRIDSCRFINTTGTAPQAGLDFEPFEAFQHMQDVLVTNSLFEGNQASGVLVGCVDLDETSPPMDIVLDNCIIRGNGLDVITNNRGGIVVTNKTRAPGSFVVRNTAIENETRSAINVQQYADDGIDVSFENVVIRNAARDPFNELAGPIIIQPVIYGQPDDDPFGNVNFDNVTVFDDQNRVHFTAQQFSGEPAVARLTGGVTICTPPGIEPKVNVGPILGNEVTIQFPACDSDGEELDVITGLNAPERVGAGRTYTVEIEYEASQPRDVITTFQLSSGSYQSFAYVVTPIPAGEGVARVDLPIRSNAPTGVNAYQWSTYLVPRGGRYADRLDLAVQRGVDLVAPDALTDDEVTISRAPTSVVTGQSVDIVVSYVASQARDIITTFQFNSGSFQPFGYVVTPVPAGTGTVTIPVAIRAGAPALISGYQWSTYIVPTGAKYPDRLDISVQGGVTVTSTTVAAEPGPESPNIAAPSVGAVGLAVYPNPALHELNLVVDSPRATDGELSVFDVTGKLMLRRSVQLAEGTQTTTIPIDELADGTYLVRLDARVGHFATTRFVVAR